MKTGVGAHHQSLIDIEKQRWEGILKRIILCIQYLGKQNLALRGTNSKLFDNNNGNFLQLIEMISQFDPLLSDHVRRVQAKDNIMPHYLGKMIQNEVLSLLGSNIKKKILLMLKEARYFSTILDTTPDSSHQEQMSIVIRFVVLQSDGGYDVQEHFLGFCVTTDTTEAGLSSYVLNFLKENNINYKHMRGQGYDNGANMKGRHNGLQKKILDINSRALYVPCTAHTLNLVVNNAADVSIQTVDFFGIIQELYTFFSCSPKRWKVMKDKVSGLTLKPLADTRWESRIEAIKPLRFNLPEILSGLQKIFDSNGNGEVSFDLKTKHMALSLKNKMESFKFICAIVLWYDILSNVNIVSKMLQNTKISLVDSTEKLKSLEKILINFRTDDHFHKLCNSASLVAESIQLDPDFLPESRRRRRNQFDYQRGEETLLSSKDSFRINFFLAVLDRTIQAIRETHVNFNI
nr:zinc finger MYM-type protein 1-like [Onthophagus taurus]